MSHLTSLDESKLVEVREFGENQKSKKLERYLIYETKRTKHKYQNRKYLQFISIGK